MDGYDEEEQSITMASVLLDMARRGLPCQSMVLTPNVETGLEMFTTIFLLGPDALKRAGAFLPLFMHYQQPPGKFMLQLAASDPIIFICEWMRETRHPWSKVVTIFGGTPFIHLSFYGESIAKEALGIFANIVEL